MVQVTHDVDFIIYQIETIAADKLPAAILHKRLSSCNSLLVNYLKKISHKYIEMSWHQKCRSNLDREVFFFAVRMYSCAPTNSTIAAYKENSKLNLSIEHSWQHYLARVPPGSYNYLNSRRNPSLLRSPPSRQHWRTEYPTAPTHPYLVSTFNCLLVLYNISHTDWMQSWTSRAESASFPVHKLHYPVTGNR